MSNYCLVTEVQVTTCSRLLHDSATAGSRTRDLFDRVYRGATKPQLIRGTPTAKRSIAMFTSDVQ